MVVSIAPDLQARLASVQVISFDLDDTLWPLESVLLAAEQAQYEWLEQHTPEIAARYSSESLLDWRREMLATKPELRGDVTAMRNFTLRELFRSFDYSAADTESMTEAVFQVFYRARSQVTLFDGALECLQRLKQGYKLAAITNGNADLELAGVAHLFDDARFATLETLAKPDAFMFYQTAEALGVETGQILHVGDNPDTDVGGGQRAGALTAWYNPAGLHWPAELDPPSVVLSALDDLFSYLPGTA